MDMGTMLLGGMGMGGGFGDFGFSGAAVDPGMGYAPSAGKAGVGGGFGSGSGGGMGGFGQMFSGLFQGMAAQEQAAAEAAAAEAEARSREQKAAFARAAGQRRALDRTREGNLAASRALALAAASGAGATGTGSFDDTLGDIFQRSEYYRGLEMATSENEARGELDAAEAARYRARIAKMRGSNAFLGSMLSGFGSMFKSSSRFG